MYNWTNRWLAINNGNAIDALNTILICMQICREASQPRARCTFLIWWQHAIIIDICQIISLLLFDIFFGMLIAKSIYSRPTLSIRRDISSNISHLGNLWNNVSDEEVWFYLK